MNLVLICLGSGIGIGHRACILIDPTMPEAPLFGIRIVSPLSLNPFEVTEPRAIRVLIEHSNRNKIRGSGAGQGQTPPCRNRNSNLGRSEQPQPKVAAISQGQRTSDGLGKRDPETVGEPAARPAPLAPPAVKLEPVK